MIVHSCTVEGVKKSTAGRNYAFHGGWAFIWPCTKVHYWKEIATSDIGEYQALCDARATLSDGNFALHAGSWPTCKYCLRLEINEQTRSESFGPESEQGWSE